MWLGTEGYMECVEEFGEKLSWETEETEGYLK
jgi:hypothetical protein